jgi:cytoskeletal protein RodZ
VEVGKQLFEARQRHGLTLETISQSTKIPVSLLRAIECDDASRLPQGFFTRAFVRAYANEVGLNADELLDHGELGEVEEVAVAPPAAEGPIQETSSSRSFFGALALAAMCAM